MTIQEFIEQLRQETGISYIDVICKKKHETIFRYASGEGVTGKELFDFIADLPTNVEE